MRLFAFARERALAGVGAGSFARERAQVVMSLSRSRANGVAPTPKNEGWRANEAAPGVESGCEVGKKATRLLKWRAETGFSPNIMALSGRLC